jgi:predicted transglutaminase-like cysteine proteinase
MADNIIEKVFCGRVIDARDEATLQSDGFEAQSQAKGQQITALQVQLINIEREKNTLISSANATSQEQLNKIAALEKEKTDLQTKYSELLAQQGATIPPTYTQDDINFTKLSSATQAKLLAYENKYTKVLITYPARFVGKDVNNSIEMDVKTFLASGLNAWELNAWVAEHNTSVKQVMKDYPTKSYDEACEIAAVRVQARLENPYGYDNASAGRNEFWFFAIETFLGSIKKNMRFDCDDWAILKYILMRISGIPDKMLRLVTGTTFSNEGHATLSFFSPSRNFFVHINSTSRCADNDKISNFVRMGDSSEQLNIQTPWWSSTATFSHMQMITDAQAKEVRRRKRDNKHENRFVRKAKFYNLETGAKI